MSDSSVSGIPGTGGATPWLTERRRSKLYFVPCFYRSSKFLFLNTGDPKRLGASVTGSVAPKSPTPTFTPSVSGTPTLSTLEGITSPPTPRPRERDSLRADRPRADHNRPRGGRCQSRRDESPSGLRSAPTSQHPGSPSDERPPVE